MISTPAQRLLRILVERPGRWDIEEIARDLHMSKTAVRRAMVELEEARLVNIYIEEGLE